ncbi:hypothetical protein CS542_05715 [Pedobacter sp. IW39]|nr:hypothetical protein CS542_05715 [Pedobacter sp. IW39]
MVQYLFDTNNKSAFNSAVQSVMVACRKTFNLQKMVHNDAEYDQLRMEVNIPVDTTKMGIYRKTGKKQIL